jgi:hypothetical protein
MESAYVTRSSTFIEYMKLHLISLNQDKYKHELDYVDNENDDAIDEIVYLNGQILATEHLLSVANDIMMSSNERYNNE